MIKPYIVGIAGGTASGKTSIAQSVAKHFGANILYISHDRYYRDQSHLTMDQRILNNYDHPDSLETDLLITHLIELIKNNAVELPQYDFTIHTRQAETTHVKPEQIILVEGILVFHNQALRDLMDLKVFVDVEDDVRVCRRISRDVAERHRTVDATIEQYLTTIKPMHKLFIEPTKEFADIIVPHGGHNQKAIDILIQAITKAL